VVVGASVGAALADGSRTTDAVMAAADVALYEAKRSGRSAWRLGRPDGDPPRSGAGGDVSRGAGSASP
jgi:predicted signal transduction protein with EAL and GGDEF domain